MHPQASVNHNLQPHIGESFSLIMLQVKLYETFMNLLLESMEPHMTRPRTQISQ